MGADTVRIGVSSLVLNAANFVLFDLLLAAAVYYLTADLAGLVNSKSAVEATEEAISFHTPAFLGIGVGITCTRRRVFYILSFLRIVSILLIFISSMSFIGGSSCAIEKKESNVTWIGPFSPQETKSSLSQRIVARQSCQGRTDSAVFYGELRGDNFCERKQDRIGPTVYIDFFHEWQNISFISCTRDFLEESAYRCGTQDESFINCRYASLTSKDNNCAISGKTPSQKCVPQDSSNTTFVCGSKTFTNCRQRFLTKYQNFRCQNAMISCIVGLFNFPCKGTWNIGSVTHLCKGSYTFFPALKEAAQKGQGLISGSEWAMCKKAKGADWRRDDWFPYMVRDIDSLEEAMAALYASGSVKRMVTIQKSRNFTRVQPFWFVMLSLKLATILILGVIVLFLRNWRRYERVANDEVGLGLLLRASSKPVDELTSDVEARSEVSKTSIFVEMHEEVVRMSNEITEEGAIR